MLGKNLTVKIYYQWAISHNLTHDLKGMEKLFECRLEDFRKAFESIIVRASNFEVIIERIKISIWLFTVLKLKI